MPKKKSDTYRVWIAQVNQTFVDVEAKDADEAREKGYRKWRREDAHSHITHVENQNRREMAKPRAPVEFENADQGEEG